MEPDDNDFPAYLYPGPVRQHYQHDWKSYLPTRQGAAARDYFSGLWAEWAAQQEAERPPRGRGCVVALGLLVALLSVGIITLIAIFVVYQEKNGQVAPQLTTAAPEDVLTNQTVEMSVPPDGFQRFVVQSPDSTPIAVEVALPSGDHVVLAVYARAGGPPDHVIYDQVQRVVIGARKRRQVGGLGASHMITFAGLGPKVHVGVYNGGKAPYTGAGSLIMTRERRCAVDCAAAGHGRCVDGTCVCDGGWTGTDCGIGPGTCPPPACSGHGHLTAAGRCVCDAGWTGATCNTAVSSTTEATVTSAPAPVTCPAPTCSSRGTLTQGGTCSCLPGWTGLLCEEGPPCPTTLPYTDTTPTRPTDTPGVADTTPYGGDTGTTPFGVATETTELVTSATGGPVTCPPLRCSSHGRVLDGTCVCDGGWTGYFCENSIGVPTVTSPYDDVTSPSNDVTSPGGCPVCPSLRCTPHGTPGADGRCRCEAGWAGEYCHIQDGSTVTADVAICPTQEMTSQAPTDPPGVNNVGQGETVALTLPPGEQRFVEFVTTGLSDLTLKPVDTLPAAPLAVYARRGAAPNFAAYEAHAVLAAGGDTRLLRLAAGSWVLGFYNGGGATVRVRIAFTFTASERTCPNDCGGHGVCEAGVCRCMAGWTGAACDTADRVPCIPNNCTEHGRYKDGVCQCDPGWTDQYCGTAECPAGCSGRGQCEAGVCRCQPGWKGDDCGTVDCIPSDCNNHGVCVSGTCTCDSNHQGAVCDIDLLRCPADCSAHGQCNNATGVCSCMPPWLAPDCSLLSCTDCSEYGVCSNGTCVCSAGWAGVSCRQKLCTDGCVHGPCDNGTCVCEVGWNGETCSTDGCAQNCSLHGACAQNAAGKWSCRCYTGYQGDLCELAQEVNCQDSLDNNNNGFTDCFDPDCCQDDACKNTDTCRTPVDPGTIASETNRSSSQNFVDQVAFLLGIQENADPDAIDADRLCVLRGRLQLRSGVALPAAQVTAAKQPRLGRTRSRADGRYDLVLNCGGQVFLQFTKPGFLLSERGVDTRVQAFIDVAPVSLIPASTKVTDVSSNATSIQEAVGETVVDEDGKRTPALLIKPGTTISVVGRDGNVTELETASMRVTEFTVGDGGQSAMPTDLAPQIAYTFAADFTVDQAEVNDSVSVVFSRPVPFYVENYLQFPVGTAVPTGFLNRETNTWQAVPNGRVIEVLPPPTLSAARVDLDLQGARVAASKALLDELDISEEEMQVLRLRYAVGTQLWRVLLNHLTPYDCNWPFGPPDGSCAPGECDKLKDPENDDCGGGGSSKASGRRRRRRSIASPVKRRIEQAIAAGAVASSPSSGRPGVTYSGATLQPPLHIESWQGVYGMTGQEGDTCAVSRATCGLLYTTDVGMQAPSRLVLSVPGTELHLVYNHFRQRGYVAAINVPLSGPNFPETARSIKVEIKVAGVRHAAKLQPKKNLSYTWVWDRKDVYEREVHGDVMAVATICYEYPLIYYSVGSDWRASFNRFSNANLRSRISRSSKSGDFCVNREVELSGNSLPEVGLGGWTLDVHHSYSSNTGKLLLGTGEQRIINHDHVLKTVAGSDQARFNCKACGEGSPLQAQLAAPVAVAEGLDGALYIGDYQFIRCLKDGLLTTLVTLTWTPRLRYFLTTDPADGSLLLSDPASRRLYRVHTAGAARGTLSVLAGTGGACPPWATTCGDEGPATAATFTSLRGVAAGKDGNIFVVDNKRIRVVGSDGLISNYAGTNRRRHQRLARLSDRYKQPFDALTFTNPTDLLVDRDDSLYVIDETRVLRLSKEGRLQVVAGVAAEEGTAGYRAARGGGREARTASLHEFTAPLESIDLSSAGKLYVSETNYRTINRIHRVDPALDTISRVVGTPPSCDCSQRNCPCYGGEGKLPTAERIYAPLDLVFTQKGQLVFADQGNRRVRGVRLQTRNSLIGETDLVIPDESGSLLYVFSSLGYHLRTLSTFTKAIIYEFVYEDDYTLKAVVDGFNKTMSVERRPDGRLHAFVAPSGERSIVTLDTNDMLTKVAEETGVTAEFTYDSGGLVQTHTPPDGCKQTYGYNTMGRVQKIFRGQNIVQVFSRSKSAKGSKISSATSLTGREQRIETQIEGHKVTTHVHQGHVDSLVEQDTEAQEITRISANGMRVSTKVAPAGQWGAALPIVTSSVLTAPSGAKLTYDFSETAYLTQSTDPLSATKVVRDVKVNGRLIKTVEKNHVDLTISLYYYFGGTKVLFRRDHYDGLGRVVRTSRPWDGLVDRTATWSEADSSYTERRGVVWTRSTYNADGNIATERRMDGISVTYGYNGEGQLTSMTLPSGRKYRYEYNNCLGLATVVMPTGSRHEMSTTNSYHQRAEIYRAPSPGGAHSRQFSPDDELINRTAPSGGDVHHTYDESSRMTSLQWDTHLVALQYAGGSQDPQRMVRYTAGVMTSELLMAWDGVMLSRMQTRVGSGADFDADFKYHYSDFQLKQIVGSVLDEAYVLDLTHDDVGNVNKYGRFEFQRQSSSNHLITDGVVACEFSHDDVGMFSGYSCTLGGSTIYELQLERQHNTTSITRQTVTVGSLPAKQRDVTYDADGQLVEVQEDGVVTETYSYDVNGNRESWTSGGSTHSALYGADDRLKDVDGTTYTYGANGFLSAIGNDRTFTYNAKGELERAVVNGEISEYSYDVFNRRVEVVTSGSRLQYFYADTLNPMRPSHVILNGHVTTLHYGPRGKLLAFTRGQQLYYVMTDHLGTPQAVFNTGGQLVKRLTYDAYGQLRADSNPDLWLPVGFAGGMLDPTTGLVHFHNRDYHPAVGRWTAKDPTFLRSGQPNLYQYVFNDPVNLYDPLGLWCVGGSFYGFYGVLGGGLSICWDSTGTTVCAEAGAGSPGAGITIDPEGTPSKDKGGSAELFLEVTGGVEFGPYSGSIQSGATLDLFRPFDPCAYKVSSTISVTDGVNTISYDVGSNKFSRSVGKGFPVGKPPTQKKKGVFTKPQVKAGIKGCYTT